MPTSLRQRSVAKTASVGGARGKRNVPLCICWYHFSAALQDNEERFPHVLLTPRHPRFPYLPACAVTRSGQFYSAGDARHGPLPSCYLPEATRKRYNGAIAGAGGQGQQRARWIKNEDKSVPGIVARGGQKPRKVSAEARRVSLEQ